ncbi:NUDIX hydrolase N-terminal domain-containing protein [Lactococcus lactis]
MRTFLRERCLDIERYHEIKAISSQLLEHSTTLTKEELTALFRPNNSYPTPMIDVRAFIQNEEKEILFVRDKIQGDWALPGGYGEIGFTPSENLLKELKEEAGVSGEIERLLAIFDTDKWQPQGKQYYKFVFKCKALSIDFLENSETSETKFIKRSELTNLSVKRTTMSQLSLLEKLSKTGKQYID